MLLAQHLAQRLLRLRVRLAQPPASNLVVAVRGEARHRVVEESLGLSVTPRWGQRVVGHEGLHPLVRLDDLLLPLLHTTSSLRNGRFRDVSGASALRTGIPWHLEQSRDTCGAIASHEVSRRIARR